VRQDFAKSRDTLYTKSGRTRPRGLAFDGRIMWNGSLYGFRDEAALYDNTFQQYGQIFIMNADGSGKRMLTDSRWEDSMPLLVPAKFL
jgi:hypothetical protein